MSLRALRRGRAGYRRRCGIGQVAATCACRDVRCEAYHARDTISGASGGFNPLAVACFSLLTSPSNCPYRPALKATRQPTHRAARARTTVQRRRARNDWLRARFRVAWRINPAARTAPERATIAGRTPAGPSQSPCRGRVFALAPHARDQPLHRWRSAATTRAEARPTARTAQP